MVGEKGHQITTQNEEGGKEREMTSKMKENQPGEASKSRQEAKDIKYTGQGPARVS